eukprot:839876-Amphidinium_carterae.3
MLRNNIAFQRLLACNLLGQDSMAVLCALPAAKAATVSLQQFAHLGHLPNKTAPRLDPPSGFSVAAKNCTRVPTQRVPRQFSKTF